MENKKLVTKEDLLKIFRDNEQEFWNYDMYEHVDTGISKDDYEDVIEEILNLCNGSYNKTTKEEDTYKNASENMEV